MIRYTEYGWLADENTENIDIYAYFRNEVDWAENNDVLSVAVTQERDYSWKVEISSNKNETVRTIYLMDSFNAHQLIRFLDDLLGVTMYYNNIDD